MISNRLVNLIFHGVTLSRKLGGTVLCFDKKTCTFRNDPLSNGQVRKNYWLFVIHAVAQILKIMKLNSEGDIQGYNVAIVFCFGTILNLLLYSIPVLFAEQLLELCNNTLGLLRYIQSKHLLGKFK